MTEHMICERHPWNVWPHDECMGPGRPASAAMRIMRQRERTFRSGMQMCDMMIADLYHAAASEGSREAL